MELCWETEFGTWIEAWMQTKIERWILAESALVVASRAIYCKFVELLKRCNFPVASHNRLSSSQTHLPYSLQTCLFVGNSRYLGLLIF